MDAEWIAARWRTVFQPEADIQSVPLPALGTGPDFSIHNALALGWICHAVYIKDAERRSAMMGEAGLHELAHHTDLQLHWSQIEVTDCPGHQIIAFRGTSDLRHWLFNINTILCNWEAGGKVHGGFGRAFAKILGPLEDVLAGRPATHLWLTGHSLGGALALLASTTLDAEATYTFGCPRTGNPSFAELVAQKPVYRVVHGQDIVTAIPYAIDFLNNYAYKHAGTVAHLRQDLPLLLGDESGLPQTVDSWRQALYAMLEGDHVGEPLPALQDHAPSSYVSALLGSTEGKGLLDGS